MWHGSTDVSDPRKIYIAQISRLLDDCGFTLLPASANFVGQNFQIDSKPVMVAAFLLAHACAYYRIHTRDPILLVRSVETGYKSLTFIKNLYDSGALTREEWNVAQGLFGPIFNQDGEASRKHAHWLLSSMGDSELLVFIGEPSEGEQKAGEIIRGAYNEYLQTHPQEETSQQRNWRSLQEIEEEIARQRVRNSKKRWRLF